MLITRRGAIAGSIPFLLTRSQAQVTPAMVRLRSELEPLTTLYESTDRSKCPELLASQLRNGTPYVQLMAAVFLAGVRNVNPRPPGYAICQAKDAAETAGDYRMTELTGPMPSPERAIPDLIRGLREWNADRAERAVAVASKYAGFEQIFDVLWTYGVRDFRYVGHKAIYVANAYRTLMTIGWQHAEPVLRSLVVSLVDPAPETRVGNYVMEDQVWFANQKRAATPVPADRFGAPADPAATSGIVKAIRTAPPNEVCEDVLHRLLKGASAASVWDAIHLAAAEVAMRIGDRNIAEIHALTSANAMHFIWRMAGGPHTRLLVLLQAAGWAGQARAEAEKLDANLRKADILSLPDDTISHVLTEQARTDYLQAALKNAVTRANEPHYYKYPVAVVEDTALISERWRPNFAAAMAQYSKTAADPNTGVMEQALEFM